MRSYFKIRTTFIAYLLFAFCAIQFSTVHIHHSESHESELSHSHQIEVHLYNSDVLNVDVIAHSEHSDSIPSVEVEYDSTLLSFIKHISNHSSFSYWHRSNSVTITVPNRLLDNVVTVITKNYIPYLRSQAPPVIS